MKLEVISPELLYRNRRESNVTGPGYQNFRFQNGVYAHNTMSRRAKFAAVLACVIKLPAEIVSFQILFTSRKNSVICDFWLLVNLCMQDEL